MIKSNSYSLKKIVFGLSAFVSVLSAEVALLFATSQFLSGGLIDQLPTLLVLVGVAAIVNYILNLALSRYFSALGSTVVSVLLVLVLNVVAFYLEFELAYQLFAVLLITRLVTVIYDVSLLNLASSYVNQRQAKAFLPLVRGLMDLAIMLGSIIVFLSAWEGVSLQPLWLVAGGGTLTLVLFIVINRLFDPANGEARTEIPARLGEQMKNSWRFVIRESRLYRLFTLLFLAFGAILVVYTYVYTSVLAATLHGENLTMFLAVASFLAVFLRMVLNLKFLSLAINRFGLANLLLLYPWGLFLLSFLVIILPDSLYLAAALFVFHTFSFYSYVTVAGQSMLGLIPRGISQQAFFLIRGLMPSLSALVVSLLMALMLAMCGHNHLSIDLLLFVLAAVTMVLTLRIRKEYQKELLRCVSDEDVYLKTNAVELMGENVQMETGERALRKMLLDTRESVILRQKILTSLVEINNPNSIRELLLIVEKDHNMRLRFYAMQAINRMFQTLNHKRFGTMTVTKLLLIDVINRVYEEDLPLPMKLEVNKALPMFGFEVLLQFYKTHFANSPDFVKASIIEAMAFANDRGLISLLEPYLTHENMQIRAAAISALWPFEEMRDRLMGLVIEILSGKDDVCRMAALKLISTLGMKKMENYVLDLVAMPEKQVSTMAVITAISLGRRSALKVLMRKLNRFAMMGDTVMVEFVFRKIMVLSGTCNHCIVNELRSLDTASFNRLRKIFNDSDQFFDLSLAELFTS